MTIPHIDRTLTAAAVHLEESTLSPDLTGLSPALREALTGLLNELAERDHQPSADDTEPDSNCYSCGGTGEVYAGTGPAGHTWTGESCCCSHPHCGCGSCEGFPCSLASYALAVAAALGVEAVEVDPPAPAPPTPPPVPGASPF